MAIILGRKEQEPPPLKVQPLFVILSGVRIAQGDAGEGARPPLSAPTVCFTYATCAPRTHPSPLPKKFWARADITVTYSPMRDVKLGHYIQNIVFKTLNLGRIFFVAICFTKKLGNVFRPLQHLIRYRYGRYLYLTKNKLFEIVWLLGTVLEIKIVGNTQQRARFFSLVHTVQYRTVYTRMYGLICIFPRMLTFWPRNKLKLSCIFLQNSYFCSIQL